MIKDWYSEDIYIADFTQYSSREEVDSDVPRGVVIGTAENGLIPSFALADENHFPFIVVNNEKNPALFKRPDGTKVSQCECIVYSERNDNKKAWMFFLELKYCKAENLYANMLDGLHQLKVTCRHVFETLRAFDAHSFKKYLVISTPGVTPLDPFDSFYFNQDDILSIKEETGAIVKASNCAFIKTPAVIAFQESR